MFNKNDINTIIILMAKYNPSTEVEIKNIMDYEGFDRKNEIHQELFNIAFQIYNQK